MLSELTCIHTHRCNNINIGCNEYTISEKDNIFVIILYVYGISAIMIKPSRRVAELRSSAVDLLTRHNITFWNKSAAGRLSLIIIYETNFN